MRRLIIALLGLVATAGPALAATPDKVAFRPRLIFPTGYGPRCLAIGDINRDGKPDLVVGTVGAFAGLDVYYGRGDGTFRIGNSGQPVYSGPVFQVAIADLNLDGKPDVLVNSGAVTVLRGWGGGTFETGATVPVNPDGFQVGVGDFNRDGKLDLVGTAPEFGFYVSLGDGRGRFGSPSKVYGDGHSAGVYAVADLDRDDKLDLVTIVQDAVDDGFVIFTKIRLGRGDGTFWGGAVLPAAADANVADLNFDGKPDIVLLAYDGHALVGLGRGDGTFQALKSFATGRGLGSLAVADMNRDGKPDLVVTNYDDGTISVLLGRGDGTFQPRQVFGAGHGPISLAVADLNQDGFPDVAFTSQLDDTVSVLLGTAP